MITIISGTNRTGSRTLQVATHYYNLLQHLGQEVHLVSLVGYDVLTRNEEVKQLETELLIPSEKFIFVMPEYNYGMPPAMLNAIDFVFSEWNYKPAALVSYGGISGGLRSAQMSKLVLTTVKLVPLTEAISIPFFAKKINEDGVFISDKLIDSSYDIMMDELLKWTKGLKYMRENIISQA